MVASVAGFSVDAYAADAADMPVIMTLKSNIYGYQGPENSFTFYLGSTEKDCEFYVSGPKTQEYIFVNPYSVGTGSDGDRTTIATPVTVSVTEADNTIEIRGDASKIEFIDVHGCYLNGLELSPAMTNLSVIDMSHNELTAIDLSPFEGLGSIDLTDNAFSIPEKMKIGTNHPYLIILQVGINDVVDPELELKNFPNLKYFSGRNNYGIRSIDPSQNPYLVSLVLEVTNITSLDVSKNTLLDVLNISNTKVNSIDLSKNVNLGEFYASHEGSYNNNDAYKFTSIDVSKNTKLQYLDMSGNKLTSIDLTNNPDLILLYLQKNRISEIDLSKNLRLASVNLSNNLFTFATLPLPGYGWDYYYYRQPLECAFKYKVGEPIDFSKDVIRAPYQDASGNTITPATYAAVFVAPRAQQEYELEASAYTYADGVLTFKEAVADSVYVKFHCTAFEDWDLESARFMVKTEEDFDKPSTAFTFTPSTSMAGKTVSFRMGGAPVAAGLSYPADIIIKAGDNETVLTGAITGRNLPESDNISFTLPSTSDAVQVLITDGFAATNLQMDRVMMKAIDLSTAEDLTTLSVTNAGLPSIDLGYNSMLRSIDLSGNNLTSIDFSGVRGDFEKWSLSEINLSNNFLTSISAVHYESFKTLNLSNNFFTDFDFKYYTGLKNLDMSSNKLSGTLDMTKVEAIESLCLSDNEIYSVDVSWDAIRNLDLRNNNMSMATLPVINRSGVTYNYAPQNVYSILAGGAAVNLSAQNINKATKYVWKYADTKAEVDSKLYTIEDGSTRFSDELIGKKVYCEMTNPAFPQFDAQPLTTSVLEVLDKPTNLVAQFTTLRSGNAQIGFRFNTSGANAIYIDWHGDGSQYDEYIYDDNNTAIYRSGNSVAGATAKVYTFGDPSTVSMFFTNGIAMKDLDLTPMTKAEAINVHSAGLTDGSIKLPASTLLFELVLDGNAFETQSFPGYDRISSLNLANNNYKAIDLSVYPGVRFAQLSNNSIASIKFGNNKSLYQLDLTDNELSEIDLTGLSSLTELVIPDNKLYNIDLSPVQKQLGALSIAGNYFTFETLPRVEDITSPYFNTYYYANQHPITVSCVEGKVDLSAQAKVGENETTFRWFLGEKQEDVYYDYYYEMFMGEELEGPDASNDPEYSTKNGVTSFHYTQKRRVIGAMTNEAYPNLILYTTPTAIDKAAGVDNVSVDAQSTNVDVYTIGGMRIKSGVERDDALNGLTPGLYIVDGKKVLVK